MQTLYLFDVSLTNKYHDYEYHIVACSPIAAHKRALLRYRKAGYRADIMFVEIKRACVIDEVYAK